MSLPACHCGDPGCARAILDELFEEVPPAVLATFLERIREARDGGAGYNVKLITEGRGGHPERFDVEPHPPLWTRTREGRPQSKVS